MPASEYQLRTVAALRNHFDDVRPEWSVVTGATDAFRADVARYAPRADIAVGPFNTTPGQGEPVIGPDMLPGFLRALFHDRPCNRNPRCLLAIEVVYSGTSKHILGDLLNAGALGLYGLVVGRDDQMPKIDRIARYLELLGELEKLPWLFGNVVTLSATELDTLLE